MQQIRVRATRNGFKRTDFESLDLPQSAAAWPFQPLTAARLHYNGALHKHPLTAGARERGAQYRPAINGCGCTKYD